MLIKWHDPKLLFRKHCGCRGCCSTFFKWTLLKKKVWEGKRSRAINCFTVAVLVFLLSALVHLAEKKITNQCLNVESFWLNLQALCSSGILRGVSLHDRSILLVWTHPAHLVQVIWWVQTGVLDQGETWNLQWRGTPRTRIMATAVSKSSLHHIPRLFVLLHLFKMVWNQSLQMRTDMSIYVSDYMAEDQPNRFCL